MSCASCISHIEGGLSKLEGIKKVAVNFPAKQVSIEADEGAPSKEELMKLITSMSYPASEEVKPDRSNLILKIRCYSSILLSLPLLLQMVIPGWHISGYLEWGLATVVQFWGGYPFYKYSWNAIKVKSLNMDVLVALGTSASYFFSVFNLLFEKNGFLYFETSAVLISLILLGRVFEQRAYENAEKGMKSLLT